jgi:hypothetical protein
MPKSNILDNLHDNPLVIKRRMKMADGVYHQSYKLTKNAENLAISMYGQGLTYQKIAEEFTKLGLPMTFNQLCSYIHRNKMFLEKMKSAKKSRAQVFENLAIQTAENESGDVHRDRLKVDTYRWTAEVNDPETYGKKTKIEGAQGAIQIVVDTGIKRDNEKPIDVEFKNVETEDKSSS